MTHESPDPLWRTLQTQINKVTTDLSDVQDAIQGRPQLGWPGIATRVKDLETRVHTLKEIQDDFIKEDQKRQEQQRKRDQKRDKFQNIMFTALGGLVTGIILLLLSILITGGAGAITP